MRNRAGLPRRSRCRACSSSTSTTRRCARCSRAWARGPTRATSMRWPSKRCATPARARSRSTCCCRSRATATARLSRALARDGAPVVLAAAGLRGPALHGAPASGEAAAMHRTAKAAAGSALPAQPWPELAWPVRSLWPAPEQMPRIGVITDPLDDDGRLRRTSLWHEAEGQRWPSFSLAVWQATAPAGAAANDVRLAGRCTGPHCGAGAVARAHGAGAAVRRAGARGARRCR